MTQHPGYVKQKWAGIDKFQCISCSVDSMIEHVVIEHVRLCHGGPIPMPEVDMTLEDWVIAEREKSLLKGKKIALGFLTWNQVEASLLAAQALADEYDRLEAMTARAMIFWVDNGSSDGTVEHVSNVLPQKDALLHRMQENQGAAIARNKIIDAARSWGADYLLMLDGDIEPIPYSTYSLAVYLATEHPHVGCIGMYPANCSRDIRPETSLDCRKIAPWRVKKDLPVALTQYGMFRMKVFNSCRFDENFGRGWGLEDDDLYLQMYKYAWRVEYDPGYYYLHRSLHSSIPLLGKEWTIRNFNERRAHLLSKWRKDITVSHLLERISAMDISRMVANL